MRDDLAEGVAQLAAQAPMPAVAVSVFGVDEVLSHGAWGTANMRTGEPATLDHHWDLASLTKMLVTLPEILSLVESSALGLDQRMGDAWETAHGTDIGEATIRQVLAYDAGMPASELFYTQEPTANRIRAAALATPRNRPIGSGAVYSDIGAMVCGFMVADLVGPLDELALQRSGLRFGVEPGIAVATEDCPWRGRLIKGEVHDENAFALGGVAGQAGAFGTLAQVTRAVQRWMAATSIQGTVWAMSVREQSSNPDGERFGLGWWLAPTRGLGGPSPGDDAWGCSGFVGNRIWVEPSRGFGVVVLSNRIHPTRGERGPYNAWCDELLGLVAHAAGTL